ncbi:MAG: methyltransferase domain-containing protein [Bdellovibrionia bacterium]
MQEPRFEKLLRRFRIRRILPYVGQNDVLVDVGCGWEAKALKDLAPRISKGYGIDLKVEPAGLPPHIKLIAQRFENFPWPIEENSCDKAIMLAVLEHIDQNLAQAVLRNIHRLLRPNGMFLLTVPTPLSKPVLEFLAYRLGIVNPDEIRDHKIYYGRKLLKKTLEDNGFRVKKYSKFQFGLNSFCVAERV